MLLIPLLQFLYLDAAPKLWPYFNQKIPYVSNYFTVSHLPPITHMKSHTHTSLPALFAIYSLISKNFFYPAYLPLHDCALTYSHRHGYLNMLFMLFVSFYCSFI